MGVKKLITISLCMIVKNEEDVLERCLNCAKEFADEIIIVDTGSTDKTVEIAKKFTDKVYHFKWVNDFSKARNYSFSKATMDYIMWMDADDVVLPEDIEKIKELKKTLDKSVDCVMMKYNIAFDENGNPTFSYYRERLLKREKNFTWHEPVHECITPSGNIIEVDIAITHKKEKHTSSDRNLKIYESLIMRGEKLSPRGQLYYARELSDHGKFDKAIAQFEKFLKIPNTWIEDFVTACLKLSHCYRMINEKEKALGVLFKTFERTTPRSEVCCNIASILFEKGMLNEAKFWYELVLNLKQEKTWGFVNHDYLGFIPAIQLCVIYDRLGDREQAIKYNNLAKKFKPNHPSVLYNEKYFESVKK